MLDRGTLTAEDLAIQVHGGTLPNLGPNFHTAEALLDALDYYDTYNNVTASGAQPLTSYMAHSTPEDPEQRALEREFEKIMDEEMWKMDNGVGDVTVDVEMTDVDMDLDGEIGNDAEMDYLDNTQIDDDTAELIQPPDDDEDCPDPFEPDDDFFMSSGNRAMSTLPPYILTIYAVTTWLHLQWHLPRAACNALLSILSCMLLFIAPQLEIPFLTLQSATRVLALDTPFYTLPCCPTCREVYPPAGSTHDKDTCMTCKIPLFLPDTTKRGFVRAKKIPYVKYPYLPLSVQIRSILTIPGVEHTLDEWRLKPRSPGHYTDIFDGDMCRLKLKAPNGGLFFSNGPLERQGPDKELRIGVNLGVDWLVLVCLYLFVALRFFIGSHMYAVTLHHPIHRVRRHFRSVTFPLSIGE